MNLCTLYHRIATYHSVVIGHWYCYIVCVVWLSSSYESLMALCHMVIAYCLVVIVAWSSSILTQLLSLSYCLSSHRYCLLSNRNSLPVTWILSREYRHIS